MKKKALHEIIEDDLLDKITSGFYQINEVLPTEFELAEHYGVSRPTVRQATQSLVHKGCLERKKRKGTYVISQKINQEFTQVIESFDSEMSRKGLETKTKVLFFKEVKANQDVAKKLQIKEREEVYKLIRLRYAQENPVVLVTTYLPKKLLPNIINIDFTNQSLYSILSSFNLSVQNIYRKLDVIKADETTSDLLDVAENDPLFYFQSIGYTYNALPIEYSISKYRGDLNSFVFTISNNQS